MSRLALCRKKSFIDDFIITLIAGLFSYLLEQLPYHNKDLENKNNLTQKHVFIRIRNVLNISYASVVNRIKLQSKKIIMSQSG